MVIGLAVTVRFFAAARAAVGADERALTVPPGTSVADLIRQLADDSPALAAVLPRCSYLYDGVAVRDTATELENGRTVDVLPPFAGG